MTNRYGIWFDTPQWTGWAIMRGPRNGVVWDVPLDFTEEEAETIVARTPGTEARLLTAADMAGVSLTADGAARSASLSFEGVNTSLSTRR